MSFHHHVKIIETQAKKYFFLNYTFVPVYTQILFKYKMILLKMHKIYLIIKAI